MLTSDTPKAECGTEAATAALAASARRCKAVNDERLRQLFDNCLRASADLPPDQRLIMYDACDDQEILEPLGACTRKRLDPRRNTKPKKPDAQLLVCTPFDPAAFNFTKIRNPGEILLELQHPHQQTTYRLLTNKFPLFKRHMLLVCADLVPQQMMPSHLVAVTDLLRSTSFCAYFNSWCASASVNHFHCHVIDEHPPVTSLPLVPGPYVEGFRCLQPANFPGFCYVLEASAVGVLSTIIGAMQADNQPHNLLFTPRFVYVFPKPLARPDRSFDLYPETVGGPELLGSFTLYQRADYERLSAADASELLKMNTAPLPSRTLRLLDDGRPIGAPPVSANHTASLVNGASVAPGALAAAPVITGLEAHRMGMLRPSKSLDSSLPFGTSMAA